MKKIKRQTELLVIALLLTTSSLFSQDSLVSITPITEENLQGIWKKDNRLVILPDEETEELREEGAPNYRKEIEYNHIYIEGNTIWEFKYPIQMYSVTTYTIENDSIILQKKPSPAPPVIHPIFGLYPDYQYGISADNNYLCFGDYCYYRDSLDMAVVNKLKNGKFNTDALIGNWVLETSLSLGYDGTADYVYPWEVPTRLSITKNNLHRFYGADHLYLKIDGEKKPFKISTIHRDEWDGVLELTPYQWCPKIEDKWDSLGLHTSTIYYRIYNFEE